MNDAEYQRFLQLRRDHQAEEDALLQSFRREVPTIPVGFMNAGQPMTDGAYAPGYTVMPALTVIERSDLATLSGRDPTTLTKAEAERLAALRKVEADRDAALLAREQSFADKSDAAHAAARRLAASHATPPPAPATAAGTLSRSEIDAEDKAIAEAQARNLR